MIAIVIAFGLSTYVYKQFKQVSSAKPVATGHIVVPRQAAALGTRVDASNLRLICLARRRADRRHVHAH